MMTLLSFRRSMSAVLLLAVVLTVVSDWFFYKQPTGWAMGLFGLALIGAMLVRTPGVLYRKWLGVWMALGAVLMLTLMEQPTGMTITVCAMAILALAFACRGGVGARVRTWIGRWILFPLFGWLRVVVDLEIVRKAAKHHKTHGKVPGIKLRYWVIPVLISAVFVALFTAANPIIAKWMRQVGEWFENWPDVLAPGRMVFWLVCFAVVWGLLRASPKRGVAKVLRILFQPDGRLATVNVTDSTKQPMPKKKEPLRFEQVVDYFLSPPVIMRSLILFNVIFAVQTVLDAFYLYGGWSLPEGMTHKEFAHRGAYPLIATALLAGVFVLLTFRPSAAAQKMRVARMLVFVFVAQNLFLIASAAWRLNLYVEAFSLTRWRVAAGIWMGVVAMGFVWIFIRIWTHRSNTWLIGANVATAVVVVYATSFIDFDRLIADYNVRHCLETYMLRHSGVDEMNEEVPENLDVAYLYELGPSAIPALHWFIQEQPDSKPRRVAAQAVRKLARSIKRDEDANWRDWTWREYRLRAWMAQQDMAELHESNEPGLYIDPLEEDGRSRLSQNRDYGGSMLRSVRRE